MSKRVDDLLGRMTQAEKVGQMTQAERLGLKSAADISTLRLGSVLSGGGSVPTDNTPAGWADMIDGYQTQALSTPLQIPLIYGVDAVHGHNNVVGATLFPHNIGLGASRDPAIVSQAAQVTATEVRATGIPWTFAPCLCVTRDERWGRSYEAFGEDPNLVALLAAPAVTGLQGTNAADKSGPDKVLATAKHWAGDGGTRYEPSQAGSGYPIDQGVTHVPDMTTFRKLFVDPYLPAIKAGVGSIMPSYSAIQVGDGPVVRMHEDTELNTTVLKNELKFNGFLISDWEGIDKLPGGTYAEKAGRSVNSGLDMAMAPYNYAAFIDAITGDVAGGSVSQARVDDAVRRILTQKFDLGLFEKPFADRSKQDTVGSDAHRAVARTAAAESQVLLKNANALPLSPTAKIYLAGSNADDLGRQMGGWSISWQGGAGETTVGTTIREGIAQVAPGAQVTYSADASAPIGDATVGVIAVGEPPYAEGVGDVGNNGRSLDLPAADRATITKVCAAVPTCVVLVVSGRPQLVSSQLGDIDALVASWLPGTEGAGVADVLFGKKPFTGRLPVTWPTAADQVPINVGDTTYNPAFPYGWGLRTDNAKARLSTVKAHLMGDKRDLIARSAGVSIGLALDPKNWNADGSVRNATKVIAALTVAAHLLAHTSRDTYTDDDLTLSVLRDLVQKQVAAAGGPGGSPKFGTPAAAMTATAALTARADQQLAGGHPDTAADLLVKSSRLAPTSRCRTSRTSCCGSRPRSSRPISPCRCRDLHRRDDPGAGGYGLPTAPPLPRHGWATASTGCSATGSPGFSPAPTRTARSSSSPEPGAGGPAAHGRGDPGRPARGRADPALTGPGRSPRRRPQGRGPGARRLPGPALRPFTDLDLLVAGRSTTTPSQRSKRSGTSGAARSPRPATTPTSARRSRSSIREGW